MFHVKHPSSSLLVLFRWCISLPLFFTPYRAVSLSFFLFHVKHSQNPKSLKKSQSPTLVLTFFNVNTDHFNLLHHQPSLPEMFHVKQSNDSPLSPLTPSSLTLLFFPTPAITPENLSLAIHKLLCQFVIAFLLSNTSH